MEVAEPNLPQLAYAKNAKPSILGNLRSGTTDGKTTITLIKREIMTLPCKGAELTGPSTVKMPPVRLLTPGGIYYDAEFFVVFSCSIQFGK
jgi:hypothetical protein